MASATGEISAVSEQETEEPGPKLQRTGERQVNFRDSGLHPTRSIPTARVPCISGRQVIIDELFTGKEVVPRVPDRELLTRRTLTNDTSLLRFRTFPRGYEPLPWKGTSRGGNAGQTPEDGGGEAHYHHDPQEMEVEPGLAERDPRQAAGQEAAPPQDLLQAAPVPTGLFPLTTEVVEYISQAPVLLKAGLLWAHLAEAGEKLQGQVHPGQTPAAGALTAQDLFEHPAGEPLHTIFGTGGAPGGQYDSLWNMTVPPAIDYNCLAHTGDGDTRRFQQLLLAELQERLWNTGRCPAKGDISVTSPWQGTLRATFTDPLHAAIALVDERCAPAVPLAPPPWGYADRWKHGAVGTPKASVARDVHRCPMKQDRDSLPADRTVILQSVGLVGQGVAEVANSISAGVVLEGGARNIVYIGKGRPHWEEARATALDVAIVVFSRAEEADRALRLGLPYEFYGHPVTVHKYSSTADITKFQEWELEVVARPPEGRHWHSADRVEQVLSAAKRELRSQTGMEVFPVPSPPSERGVGELITLAQPLPDRDSREACRYWVTVEAATYEAVSHRTKDRMFFHIENVKFHIACSPRSRWMTQRSPQQPPRQRPRYAGKGQGKGAKGSYYGQVQPTQLFAQDQGYGRQLPPEPPAAQAPRAGGELASLAASVKALTEVVSQQVQASDRQMSAITQLSGQVTGLLQHGVQLMPQGGQSYLGQQQQPQQLQPPPAAPLQLPHQVPLGPPQAQYSHPAQGLYPQWGTQLQQQPTAQPTAQPRPLAEALGKDPRQYGRPETGPAIPQEFDNPDGRAALKRLDELRAQTRGANPQEEGGLYTVEGRISDVQLSRYLHTIDPAPPEEMNQHKFLSKLLAKDGIDGLLANGRFAYQPLCDGEHWRALFFDQQAGEGGGTHVHLFDSYGPNPREGARGHAELLDATRTWAERRTRQGVPTEITCTKLRTQYDDFQCGVWVAVMAAAWCDWTKSPEKSTWPRAAHRAAGGTGKTTNNRVAKQHRIVMQIATKQEEHAEGQAGTRSGSSRVPGKRAVLRPLQQVTGSGQAPAQQKRQHRAGAKTVLGSWGNSARESKNEPNHHSDKENQTPPPDVGEEGRLSLMTWNIRGSDHAYYDLARSCEEHQPDVLVLTETKAAGPMGPKKLQGLGYSAWHSAPCHGIQRRGADGTSYRGGVVLALRRPYDRTDVRANREVPRCAKGYLQHVVITLPSGVKMHVLGVYNPPHPEEEVVRTCIRDYIAREAAVASRKGEHMVVGGDFNVAEIPREQDGIEQRAWRGMSDRAGLAEISCPQGPTFGDHKIDGWLASEELQRIADERHPIDTRAHRHCSDHQAAVAAVPLWKLHTTTPIVEEQAKPDPITKYQFPISKALQRSMKAAIDSALQPSLRENEFKTVIENAVDAAERGSPDARERIDEAGKAVDGVLQQAMRAVEIPLETVRCKPKVTRDPNTGVRLPKAKFRKRDKALKAAAVLQEMLAIERATGETPSAALLEEAMAEPRDTAQGRPDTCAEPEDPHWWAESEMRRFRQEAKSVIKDHKAETWETFVQKFRSNYYRMKKSAHRFVFRDRDALPKGRTLGIWDRNNKMAVGAVATAEAFSGHMAHSDPYCFEHPRTDQLDEEMPWLAAEAPDSMKPGQRPRKTELGSRLTIELYRQIVKRLPNGKAAGPDAVPNEILKAMPEEFHEVLFSLMRAMWKAGITPGTWKLGTFVYLHKKGDTSVFSNYRPIGLLRTILKLYTAMVTDVLSTFCEVNSIHSQEQMGSRKHRSTINQLLRLQHVIEDSKLSHSQLHVLYVDFENAYGSVEHDRLQHTMKYLGIPEDAVRVVADLYGGEAHRSPFRMASKIEHHSSEPLMVKRGLVQGDSLSPLLFILYLEPLLRWLKAGNKGYLHRLTDSDKPIRTSSAAYVDDLALIAESATQLAVQVRKLELYSNWSGLRINKAKCGITGTDEKGSPIPEETYEDVTMRTPRVGKHGFPYLHPDDPYKYLGIQVALSGDWTVQKQASFLQARERIQALLHSPLTSGQQEEVLRSAIIGQLRYALPLGIFSTKEIEDLDAIIGGAYKLLNGLPRGTANCYTALPKTSYGLGHTPLLATYAQSVASALQMATATREDLRERPREVFRESEAFHVKQTSQLSATTRGLVRYHYNRRQGQVDGTVRTGELDRCCTARQLAVLREHQVLLTGSGPLLADLINTQHGVISKLANAVRKPFPSALEGRHRTVVDQDTGEESVKIYSVNDQEEIPLSLTTLLPLLPFVEEGFYVAKGGTRACSLREAKTKVPARFQGRMRTFMLMLYPYICEALADKPNDARFWDNPKNLTLKPQFMPSKETHNALGFQRLAEPQATEGEELTTWEEGFHPTQSKWGPRSLWHAGRRGPPTTSMQAKNALKQMATGYCAKDEEDHEDAFIKCHDIGVRPTLLEDPGGRVMIMDSVGVRPKAEKSLSDLRHAARAGARLTEKEAMDSRRAMRRNRSEGSHADSLLKGGGRRGNAPRGEGTPRHRTEGVFSDTRGREAWLSSIQVETHSLCTTGLATVSMHQTKLADALNGTEFEQSEQYEAQMRNTMETVRDEGFSFVLTCDGSHWNVLLFGKNEDTSVSIYLYDPMGGEDTRLLTALRQWAGPPGWPPVNVTVSNMGVAHQRDGYQCGVWVCYMIDKWQEWNRSTTGEKWESWIGLHGPPVGGEATTSKGYREAMRGPIMARIGELEQRERHHVFHGEGETHDPISFEEVDDEIQEEAGAGPMQVGRSPTRQTQANMVPETPRHARELPKVGEKRTRQIIQSPQATVESEEIRPRPNPPAQTPQRETSPHRVTRVSLEDGRGTKWKGTAAQIMMLRTWVLAQLSKGDVRTGELFQHAAKIGFPRDAVRLMTTHLVSSAGPTVANDPEVLEETEEEPQAVEASESTTILAVRTHWGSREYLLGPIRPQGEAWVEEDTLLTGGIAGMNPSRAERETDTFHNKEREAQQARRPTEREPLSGTPTRHAHYWPGVTKLNIDTEPFNPDWDAAPSGKCTLTTETGRHHVFAHDERGKMVGALKEEVLDRLYDRYVAAAGTNSADQTHTRAGEERRRSFEEREPQLGTVHGFATEVVLLLKRYSCEEEEEVKKTALQNHWTLPPEIMQALQEAFGIQAEIFASPLNVHSHTATYCSKFDRDKIFGSKGSAWDTQWGELGAFEFNPEYTAADLDKALQEALMSTMAKTPVLGVGIYPAWTRTPAKAYCRRYGDTRIHEFGVIPRKSFTFLPPDHWGGTTVSGVTKKDYSNWGVRILVVANAEGWQKFCPDPEGAAELVGKALQRSTYCTVRKYHTIRNLRPANPRVHTSDAVSDMAAVKNAMENASQYDMIFDPHPMRKWEIPSMSRRQGWGNEGGEVPKEDRTPEAARAMRQTWRDRGLTEVTITEYHAANTAWPLDKIKEDSRVYAVPFLKAPATAIVYNSCCAFSEAASNVPGGIFPSGPTKLKGCLETGGILRRVGFDSQRLH
ncbi:hypothetical protein CYMTET_41113 [Cymbomonas tetramitiformis]|uniref:Reverse transcriptase domain-containing protein n=1 Tax=Cymbomonas tetramitiformis TaxID=36881 RepID=A0AAE0F2A4_9CHLO|nr:hypothetical protein CYMTET_41113 [Cymbomonas tetramitiformis]